VARIKKRFLHLWCIPKSLTIIMTQNCLSSKPTHRLLRPWGTFTLTTRLFIFQLGARTEQRDKRRDRQTGKTRNSAYYVDRIITHSAITAQINKRATVT